MDLINPIAWSDSMLTSSTVPETDYPAWDVTEVCTVGLRRMRTSTHRVYECAIAHTGSAASTATVTISIAAPGVVAWTAHGLAAGTRVVFSSTGTLPTGIIAGVAHYVSAPTANTFSLSLAPAGTAITTTGSQAGVHTATVSSSAPELNVAAVSAAPTWLEVGATNKFKLVDSKWGTQTEATTTMTVIITPGNVIDSMALLNLRGSSVHITSTVGGSTIYDKTISLQTDVGVYDWTTYFIAAIVAEDDVVVTDLLPYAFQAISITVAGSGTVAIGNVSLGAFVELGRILAAPTIGIISYSKKDVDRWGNIVVTPGVYAKRYGCRFVCDSTFVDLLESILAAVRDTPVVWIGAGSKFSSLIVWGFFKDFEIEITYGDSVSHCSINIEGLV